MVQVSGSPAGVAASGQGCSVTGATVRCTLAARAPGSSITVTVYGTAGKRGTTLTANATVDGAAADPNSGNDQDSASIQVR